MAKQGNKKKEVEFLSVRSPRKTNVGKPPAELKGVLVIAVFVVITLGFFSSHLSGSSYLWEDFTEQFLPFETYAAQSFADGQTPFWNPYTFCGMPFFADLQNGYFYPGHQIMYILAGGKLSVWLAQFVIIIHYLLAMLGMRVLARGFGIGEWGAMFAGIAYGLSGMLVAHMIHPNMVYHMAWFPLIVYFFYRGVTERSWLHSLLAGLSLGLVMLSGHPQMALYIIFFLFALTVFVVARGLTAKDAAAKAPLVPTLAAAAVPIVIGIAIFAVQFLPSQELAELSQRSTMTYEKSLEGSLGAGQLLTLVVPKFFGVVSGDTPRDMGFWYRPESYYFWETVVYFGIVTLLLASIGLASRKLGGLGWFLGGMGLLGLLYALGDNFIIHPILAKLPYFDAFRVPTRMAIYLTFVGSILGGAGLERIIRTDENNERLVKVLLIVGGGIVLIGILAVSGTLATSFGAPAQFADRVSSTGVVAVLIGALAVAASWIGLKRKGPATGVAIALVLLCAIDLFIFGVDQNTSPTNPQAMYEANERTFAAFKPTFPDNIFRVRMREGGAMLMQRNQGPYSGFMLFEGYNPLLLERLIPPAPAERAYDLTNVRYSIAADPQTGQLGFVERNTQFPHARMMYSAQIGTADEIKALLGNDAVDLATTVLLEKDPGVPMGGGEGTATITEYSANAITVGVNTDKPGVLLLSEVWYPAWKVTVDGKEAELLKANYSQRGIAVPAGQHTVALQYNSDAFNTGKWVSLTALILTCGGIVLLVVQRKRRKGDEPTT